MWIGTLLHFGDYYDARKQFHNVILISPMVKLTNKMMKRKLKLVHVYEPITGKPFIYYNM